MNRNFLRHLFQNLRGEKADHRRLVESRLPVPLVNKGFHGDEYLLELVHTLIPFVDTFVETGTYNGNTVVYTACTYPWIRCLSCEPDPNHFRFAIANTIHLPNVTVYNETSQEFMHRFKDRGVRSDRTLFWLDAHGFGFDWPLRQEVAFITNYFKSALVLIDDFKVPGLDCFGYDVYESQECSFEHIETSLNPAKSYRLFYPNYTTRTSDYHPLRGWGLIEFGETSRLCLPDSLADKVQQVPFVSQRFTPATRVSSASTYPDTNPG